MKCGSTISILFSFAVAGLWAATAAPSRVQAVDPLAPLARGLLEVWAPDTFLRGMVPIKHEYQWSPLLSEFKNDFPGFDLRFKIMDRDVLALALRSAGPSPGPDIVFVDNQDVRGPLLDSNTVIQMLSPSRFDQNGWWLIFRQSKNFESAKAFLLWLSRSPHWQPWQLATPLMGDSDSAAVQSVSSEAIKDYLRADAQSLSSLMDPQASHFYRLTGSESVAQVEPILTFGNSQLAFTLVSAVCQREKSFGISHSAMVLRKAEGQWRVLLFIDGSLPALESVLKRFDSLKLQIGHQENMPVVKLLAPADHASLPRFPAGELQWEGAESRSVSYLVESQFSNPGQANWSLSRVALLSPRRPTPVISAQIPFGVGKQPHRWRLWAISPTGDVSLSDWRTIDFTN